MIHHSPQEKSFSSHLWQAAKLNMSRLWSYAKASGGRSLPLTVILVFTELTGLFYAWVIDRKARVFQAQGIPIIQADLVRILPVHEVSEETFYGNLASDEILKNAEKTIQAYRRQAQDFLKQGAFQELAACSYRALKEIEEFEKKGGCHFLMSRHLIESIGFGALHSDSYAKRSGNHSCELSQKFLSFQVLPLKWAVSLDHLAQRSHACGLGILYHELPLIPFEKEWLDGHQEQEKVQQSKV